MDKMEYEYGIKLQALYDEWNAVYINGSTRPRWTEEN